MLATAHHSNYYTKPRIYENKWIDDHNNQFSWLNFLTAQPIPEEMDVENCFRCNRSDSYCSLSSIDDSYFVVNDQQSLSIHETMNGIEKELNYAQINENEHHLEYEQLAQSIIIQMPLKEYAMKHQIEHPYTIEEYAKVTELSKNILFHTPKSPNKAMFDSTEDGSSIQNKLTNKYSHQSSEHKTNSSRKSIIEKPTLTRTFAINRTSIKKSNHVQEQNMYMIKEKSVKSNKFSKTSSIIHLIKKHTRIIKFDDYSSNNKVKINEPSLIQIKYLDGRPTLIDIHAQQLLKKPQNLININSSQVNSLNISSTQDLSLKSSYRKRILNHFQTYFN